MNENCWEWQTCDGALSFLMFTRFYCLQPTKNVQLRISILAHVVMMYVLYLWNHASLKKIYMPFLLYLLYLKIILLSYKGGQPFKCPYCDEVFANNNSELKKHMWVSDCLLISNLLNHLQSNCLHKHVKTFKQFSN
mgnify:CR=1 FL=1